MMNSIEIINVINSIEENNRMKRERERLEKEKIELEKEHQKLLNKNRTLKTTYYEKVVQKANELFNQKSNDFAKWFLLQKIADMYKEIESKNYKIKDDINIAITFAEVANDLNKINDGDYLMICNKLNNIYKIIKAFNSI